MKPSQIAAPKQRCSVSLSQVQIIRSLGEALTWFEKELAWGVSPGELNHLTGRIGELYSAMITRGQMALATNQHGYDVVSADGERISVKTVTSANHVTFRKSTFHHVDRIQVLRIRVEEGEASIEELLDCSAADFPQHGRESDRDWVYPINKAAVPRSVPANLSTVASAQFEDLAITQFENGTITVERGGKLEPQAKPALREIAARIGVGLTNSSGNPKNTRQLGTDVLAALQAAIGVTGNALSL